MDEESKLLLKTVSEKLQEVTDDGKVSPNEVYNLVAQVDRARLILLEYGRKLSTLRNSMC